MNCHKGACGITTIAMEKNVYMASIVFFVPLNKLRAQYRCLFMKKKKEEENIDKQEVKEICTNFVLYPNAKCLFVPLCGKKYSYKIAPKEFIFQSRYNGVNLVDRKITITPFLLDFNLEKCDYHQYMLVLQVSIDMVFDKGKKQFSCTDFCTEYDLVNLKKAFFESENSTLKEENAENIKNCHQKWLECMLNELEGARRTNVRYSYSIIDVCTERLNILDKDNDLEQVKRHFKDRYYKVPYPSPINDFLNNPIQIASNGTYIHRLPRGKDFAYGLLYANDNFAMADQNNMEYIVGQCYSNNKVEKFWSDDESIIHIKTGGPFYYVGEKRERNLQNNLYDVQCVIEMCMLIYLKRWINDFKSQFKKMSSEKIEEERLKLTEAMNMNLFNFTELDIKMDFFITQFRLKKLFDEIKDVAVTRKGLLELLFVHKSNIWILVFTISSFLVSLVALFIKK